MHIDQTLLSPLSALLGALIGGTASLIAAIYTHRVLGVRLFDRSTRRVAPSEVEGLGSGRDDGCF